MFFLLDGCFCRDRWIVMHAFHDAGHWVLMDVFNLTDPIDWGSQTSQPASQPATYTAPRLWSTHPMPAGLRPERSASSLSSAAVAEQDEVIEDDANRDYILM